MGNMGWDSVDDIVCREMSRMAWEQKFQKEVNYWTERNSFGVNTMSKEERINKLENEVACLKDVIFKMEHTTDSTIYSKNQRLENKLDTATDGLIRIMTNNQLVEFVIWCKSKGYCSWIELAEKEKARRWCVEHTPLNLK